LLGSLTFYCWVKWDVIPNYKVSKVLQKNINFQSKCVLFEINTD